jgi:uncharacterized protein with PIN domain
LRKSYPFLVGSAGKAGFNRLWCGTRFLYWRGKEENMKVERPGDLIYLTYFMIDWEEVRQSPAERPCLQCGQQMSKLEASVGKGNLSYAGLVCHGCKRILWVRQG